MRTLGFSVLCFIIFQCASFPDKMGWKNSQKNQETQYFSLFDKGNEFLYNAKIDVAGHVLSGYFAIRKINTGEYRIAFTSHLGQVLLDGEYRNKTIEIYRIFDKIPFKKKFVATLEKDFEVLFLEYEFKKSKFNKNTIPVYQAQSEAQNLYFQFKNSDIEVFRVKNKKLITQYKFRQYEGVLLLAEIQHKNKNLIINLTPVKK